MIFFLNKGKLRHPEVPASTTVVQQVNPVASVVTEVLNLSADALFKFDKIVISSGIT